MLLYNACFYSISITASHWTHMLRMEHASPTLVLHSYHMHSHNVGAAWTPAIRHIYISSDVTTHHMGLSTYFISNYSLFEFFKLKFDRSLFKKFVQ